MGRLLNCESIIYVITTIVNRSVVVMGKWLRGLCLGKTGTRRQREEGWHKSQSYMEEGERRKEKGRGWRYSFTPKGFGVECLVTRRSDVAPGEVTGMDSALPTTQT